jgi:hypothetical protein
MAEFNQFIHKRKLSSLPWKEVMLGEGLLNFFLGISALIAASSFSETTYNFLHSLSYSDVRNFLLIAAKGVLSFSLLSIAVPLLFVAFTKLSGEGQDLLEAEEDENSIEQLDL